MENDTVKKIQERLAQLPEDVRNAVQDSNLEARVQAIGTRHKLHVDQMGELGDETLLAMLGFSPLETFGKRLSQTLSLAPEAGEKLAADVSTEIFGAIRESMKKFAADRTSPTATPAKPPINPELHKADVMLSEKTVSLAPKVEENPAYKADPYREPV